MPRDPAQPDPEWLIKFRKKMERLKQFREQRHTLANRLMIQWGRAALLQAQTRKLTGRG
jgi:hypothetical protein